MSEAALIRRNSLFSFLSSATRIAANMLLFVGIARFYGPEAFGQFTTAHTYLTLFFLVADFGFDLLLATEVARDRAHALDRVREFLPVKLLFSVFAVGAMCLLALFGPVSEGTRMLMLVLSVGIVGNALTNFFYSLLKGLEELHHETRTSFYQSVLLLVALVVLGIARAPILVVALAFALSRLAGVILIFPRVRTRLNTSNLRLSLSSWRSAMQKGIPFGVHLLFGTLYFQLDTLMLASMKGDHAVGVYQAVMKLIVLVLVVPDVVISAVLPVLSRLYVEDKERWSRVGGLLMKSLAYFSLPVATIFFVYAEQIIALVYGSAAFSGAAPVMRIFAVILLIRFIAEIPALMLTTSRRQVVRMYIVIGATILNFGLNVFAIPRYGITGAAVVSLVTNIAAGISYYLALHLHEIRRMFVRIEIRTMTIGLFTLCAAVILWQFRMESVFLGVAAVGVIYPLLYYFWGFTENERGIVFALPRKLTGAA